MDRSDCNEVLTLVFKETLNCVGRHLKQHLSFQLLHVADKDKSQELMFWALAPRKSKLVKKRVISYLIITITNSSNIIGTLAALFFINRSVQLLSDSVIGQLAVYLYLYLYS